MKLIKDLSPKEKEYCKEFLKLNGETGCYNKIAEKFNNSLNTIHTKFHRSIFLKFRVHSAKELLEKLKNYEL